MLWMLRYHLEHRLLELSLLVLKEQRCQKESQRRFATELDLASRLQLAHHLERSLRPSVQRVDTKLSP